MKLSEYVKKDGSTVSFAKKHGFPVPVIARFLQGTRGLSAETMAKIVEATGGQVTYEDLVAEMRERQAARKNGNNLTKDNQSV